MEVRIGYARLKSGMVVLAADFFLVSAPDFDFSLEGLKSGSISMLLGTHRKSWFAILLTDMIIDTDFQF